MTDDSGTRRDLAKEEKFALLFEMYGKAMKRKAYAILKDRGWAEDAVQIAFEKVYRHINNIEDPHSQRTKSYLNTIVSHDCFEMVKKNRKYYLMDDYTMQADFGARMVKNDNSSDNLYYESLVRDIYKMPEIYADLLIMHAVHHYTLQEISEMMELKPATVRKRLQRGRELLWKIVYGDDKE